MPEAWRIIKAKHSAHAFDGEGARLYGGRWNTPGTRMVYASQSVALATLELLVHLGDTSILEHYVVFEINFADDLVSTVEQRNLPPEWRDDPPPLHLQQMGDDWARDRISVVLCVPSAVISEERNYLLNPEHPRFRDVRIGAPTRHRFDKRLLR